MKEAYSLSLKPVTPEFRAFWEPHATGPYPGNWAAAADALAANGFNAVFPNMLWGGLAHCNSAVLPPVIRVGATAPDEPDADNDLLPDSWETYWFTNLSVAGLNTDFDNDAWRDCEEYVIGRDPKQADTGLRLQGRVTNDSFEDSLVGGAVAGPGCQNAERHYRLERTADPLAAGQWQMSVRSAEVQSWKACSLGVTACKKSL